VKRKIKLWALYLLKWIRRNSKILNSSQRKVQKNRVNLHWWSMERKDSNENVGDFLSKVVCDYMLGKKGLTFEQHISSTKHLYCIGSIIQGGMQDAVVWGSGLKNGTKDFDVLSRRIRKLDIRLVRGPKTREALLKSGYACPEKYGDPALIMPLIYTPPEREKKKYIVILHHESERTIENSITPITCDYKEFINQIYDSNLVISSSLHGIILAEAYGVPAILMSDKVTRNMFKYEDYYLSTGRASYSLASSVEEALKLPVPAVPKLEKLQKDIIDLFPYDLWEG